MRKILITAAVIAAGVAVSSSPLAQTPDVRGPSPSPTTVTQAQVAVSSKKKVVPLPVLPNIKKLEVKLWRADRKVAQRQLTSSQHVVTFFEDHAHQWMRAPRHEKCWEVPWVRTCTIARHSYRLHLTLHETAKQKLWRDIPLTDNWTRAMRITQRVFPGTYGWLERISNRECRSCYTVPGGFICNYQGSGACGPMQFMAGTFYGHADDARQALERRGFLVDPSVWDWHNPLGQALTAGYMRYTGQDNCHWCL